jgi:hypothetical protein
VKSIASWLCRIWEPRFHAPLRLVTDGPIDMRLIMDRKKMVAPASRRRGI